MDLEGLERLLRRLELARLACLRFEEASPLALEALSARPYAPDDAPLEERRTQAVMAGGGVTETPRPGRLDLEAIARFSPGLA
jgi:hypothetical protein